MTQKIIQFPKTDLCSSLSAIGTNNSEYVISVTAIQQTMVTLSKMSMPPKTDFANEPKTYDQIAKCYEKINKLAVEFTTTIYSELEYYPDACISSLGRIDASLKKAQEKVDFIMSNPKLSEDDLLYETNLLTRYMDDIVQDAERQIADLNILLNNLKIFKEKNVQTIEVLMKNILDDIKLETTEYQAAEKALEEAKKALEKEVNDQIAMLVGASIGVIAAIIGAAFVIAVSIASGGSALLVSLTVASAVIGIGGTLFAIGFSAYELDSAIKELNHTVAKLESYAADILLFSQWHDSVVKCAEQLDGIREKLTTVQDSWVKVKNGFATISTKVKKAKGNLNSREWEELKSVFAACQETSEKTKAMLESMKLGKNQFADAKLYGGMTKEQVEEALKNANMLTIKEWILAI